MSLIDYIWADRRTSDRLFFAKLNHIIHACRRPLNTSLTCPHVRMVIHLISTTILTSPPYIINYDLTYLQHFAVIMQEYRSGSELKPCNMEPDAHTCYEIFWKKEHDWLKQSCQLQMDQSPAVYCLKFGFCLQCTSGMFTLSTVYVVCLPLFIHSV